MRPPWPAWGRADERLGRPLPPIRLTATPCYLGAITAPAATLDARLHSAHGDPIGRASYALSPLADRWYVYELEVDVHARRRGYALAFLAHLQDIQPAPVTPVHELHEAKEFWAAARAGRAPGVLVTPSLSASEIPREKLRWLRLAPQARQLEREIALRFARGESWELATGRGLGPAGAACGVSCEQMDGDG